MQYAAASLYSEQAASIPNENFEYGPVILASGGFGDVVEDAKIAGHDRDFLGVDVLDI